MKKLWINFKILLIFLIFPISSHSIELSEFGLNQNRFSELQELRTIYLYNQDGKTVSIDPDDRESLIKIKEFYLNNNFLSNEADTVYQFCCDSKLSGTGIFIGKINGAEEKFKNSSPKEVLNLDKQIKIKNYLEFKNKKLFKSVFIKDDKYNLFLINSDTQEYTLLYNSTRTFEDTIASLQEVNFNVNDIAVTDFQLQIIFTPIYTLIIDIASQVSVFKVPKMNRTVILDSKTSKIIYADENLKKIEYHGDYRENVDVVNPSSFLSPTLLNFLPTEFKKILDKGKEINSNYPLNFTLKELLNLISNVETLNADNVNFAKQKESELQSIIQKKQAELKAEESKIKAEELRAAQLKEQKAQEESQKILDQKVEEENQRILAEVKRQRYIQYGLIILSIVGLIAFIFFTNFLDNLQKFLKQIFSKFKKMKVKSYLPKVKSYLPGDYEKKKNTQKKQLGIWWADWANNYEDPRSAFYMVLATLIVSILVFFTISDYQYDNKTIGSTTDSIMTWIFGVSFFIVAPISGYLTWKIYYGISEYNCPKCKRIYAGEIYEQTHLESRQRAKKYRVKDNRTLRYRDHQGNYKTDNYTVERDETGVEQIDAYHNKAKCKLCNHKWEYNATESTRVA